MFCETANGAWRLWVPPGQHGEQHGVSLTLDGAAYYNADIRGRIGREWGVGGLTEWWLAELTNTMCVDLGLPPRHPKLTAPAPLREGPVEIGIAGSSIMEFRRPAAVIAARKVGRTNHIYHKSYLPLIRM
jgi:hypothetical protein